MEKTAFIRKFKDAMEKSNTTHIAVKVKQPNMEFELIMFGREMFESKLEYYTNAYDDEMKLKAFDKISITKIEYSNNPSLLALSILNQ